MSARLAGRVALVVGGADGTGRDQAVRFAQEGADLLLLAHDDAAETVRQVEASGRRAVAIEVDVRDQRALDAALTEGVGSLGRLDVVCISAGDGPYLTAGSGTAVTVLDLPATDWQSMLDVALAGVWKTCKAAIPHLLEPRGEGGSIVLITPGRGGPGRGGHLAAAEHGLIGLMRTLAAELAPHRVRVNALTPTAPGAADVRDRGGLAEVAVFLASDEGSHLTGVTIPVPVEPHPG